ncbi:MAG: alpha/beta hydrolase [Chloroflexi bacterium]|nr:alpha/beta hydrolase [Chloroflexota bacterium]
MKQNWRAAAAVVLALVFTVSVIVLLVWMGGAHSATDTALQAMNSDASVYVSAENGWATFFPAENARPETGFIFYPGANVDYRAYAPVMKLIAAHGYFVAVTPMPLNLASFDVNAAARVQAAYPEVQHWFIGGHSLGGVAASSFVTGRAGINGLVLWTSGPADAALIKQGTPVLLVYGTNDGLFPLPMVEDARMSLPADAKFVSIEGGNHSQFGAYGFQPGDHEADISPEEQWIQVAAATVEFFTEVLK